MSPERFQAHRLDHNGVDAALDDRDFEIIKICIGSEVAVVGERQP
jgi:hypothetical protein